MAQSGWGSGCAVPAAIVSLPSAFFISGQNAVDFQRDIRRYAPHLLNRTRPSRSDADPYV